MLLSIPHPPPGGMRFRASIRDNLTLCSIQELIGVVVDLAHGNTYLGEQIWGNRPLVTGTLIPELARVTSTPPCSQCLHPHTKCVCGGQALSTSLTAAVTIPPVYTTSHTPVQPLLQSTAYGGGPAPGSYATGLGPQTTPVSSTLSILPVSFEANVGPTPMEATSLPPSDLEFRKPAPPEGNKHLQPSVPQQSAQIRQTPLP